jgi:hypothetical protein
MQGRRGFRTTIRRVGVATLAEKLRKGLIRALVLVEKLQLVRILGRKRVDGVEESVELCDIDRDERARL